MNSNDISFRKKVYEYRHNLPFLHYNMNMSYVMEAEIISQGEIIENLIKRYIVNYSVLMDVPLEIKRISIVAAGSSYNAGVFGKNFFENISQVETNVNYASEVVNSSFKTFDKDTLYILISQSGESVDTVAAMKKIKQAGAKVLCITNNLNSTMYKEADYKFDIMAGREQAIAATKTFSASVVMLWLISLKIAQNKHIDISEETKNIYLFRENFELFLKDIDNIDLAAKFLSKKKTISIVGMGLFYALSLETALKIKETSYINTTAYPLGDFIHGHFAVLNKENTILTFALNDIRDIELKLIEKIQKTYKTKTVIVSDEYEDYNADILIKFQKGQSKIATIVNMIALIQLLALKIAIRLRRNVDNPKGLNKVVRGG